MPFDFALFQRILVPLLLGSLIGLERESNAKEGKETHFAGIRTFSLIGLVGGLSQVFFEHQPVFLWILSVSVFLLIVAGYVTSSLQEKTAGATTELAAVAVYLIAMLAGRGDFFTATALTLVVLIILHFRNPLHRLAHRISPQELTSTVEFMVIAFIILPLLPNKAYGPFEVLNPYVIWLMVVFISGISFASYLGIKFLGEKRGIGLTGFLAGLVSSTALTLNYSQESRKHPRLAAPFVFAILIASSAMFIRMLFVLAVLDYAIFKMLLLPFALMGGTGLLLAWLYWKKKEKTSESEAELSRHAKNLESPFQLKPALKFAGVFAVILFFSKIAMTYAGSKGIYATSFASGLLDVDAINVSIANLAHGSLPENTARNAIFIAAVSNTLFKGAVFSILGKWESARLLLVGYGIMLLVGGLALAAFS